MQSNLNVRVTNTSHRYRLAAVAAALTVLFGAASPAVADGLHCTPDVFVKNRKGASIKVLKFAYQRKGEEPKVESLVNKRLAPGEQERWPSQRLSDAAPDHYIVQTAVQYKNDNSGAGDGYGPAVWSEWHPHTETYTCQAGRNYAHFIDIGDVESAKIEDIPPADKVPARCDFTRSRSAASADRC